MAKAKKVKRFVPFRGAQASHKSNQLFGYQNLLLKKVANARKSMVSIEEFLKKSRREGDIRQVKGFYKAENHLANLRVILNKMELDKQRAANYLNELGILGRAAKAHKEAIISMGKEIDKLRAEIQKYEKLLSA